MAAINTHGISLYYELHGNRSNPPVLLLTGMGKSWGSQIQRFFSSPRGSRASIRTPAWIERVAGLPTGPDDREIALKRIDMILARDTRSQLDDIRQPSLVSK